MKKFIVFLFFYISSGQQELLKVFDDSVNKFLKENNIDIKFIKEELEDIKTHDKEIKNCVKSNIDNYTKELSEYNKINLMKDRAKKTQQSESSFLNLLSSLFQRIKKLIQIRKEYDLYKKNIQDSISDKQTQDIYTLLEEFEKLNAFKDTDCSLKSCEKFYENYPYIDSTSNSNASYFDNFNFRYYYSESGILLNKDNIHFLFNISDVPESINADDYLTKNFYGLYVYSKNDPSRTYNVSFKLLDKGIIVGYYKKDLKDIFIVGNYFEAVACYKIGCLNSNSNLDVYLPMEKQRRGHCVYYFDDFYFKSIWFDDWSKMDEYKNLFNFEKKYLDIINKAYEEKNIKELREGKERYKKYFDDYYEYTSHDAVMKHIDDLIMFQKQDIKLKDSFSNKIIKGMLLFMLINCSCLLIGYYLNYKIKDLVVDNYI